ncbi:arsinothricin resistance N-acetyltransferase ArsN1 [Neobacillus sp. OS1-2]|uniref:arsinothricin resistance N-acetyltransferase ArsN1 family A n=1 Tax=Neobacillus sp. OS1-2 TaxID=3070680 RepID=UPI0027DFF40C|nr:arsinothricin resistance N-acetyltransferase ArsN1 family A [Neobacillus sp. OS1-2]WML38169.1 arsinothricin resistance N-acetyltransferase ArsN1 [Neobacillus sp. OS1-2]
MESGNIIRKASESDTMAILEIYNQGIEDRIATLEEETKDYSYMKEWFERHQGRYNILVAEQDGIIAGWASLNPYSNRCAYDGVADLSIYISRNHRGKGLGKQLLAEIESLASANGFHKIVLFTFPFNRLGQGLYRKMGYREVGVFRNQGKLDGEFVDVMAMEKLLLSNTY